MNKGIGWSKLSNFHRTIFSAACLFLLAGARGQSAKYLLIVDQSVNRIAMVDAGAGRIVWDWHARDGGIRPQDTGWFAAPSDVKPVYDGKYLLLNASKGGVALVRISDKKAVFYAFAGGNTHSAELLPDGNIVTASSTDNYLTIFHTDSMHFPDGVYRKRITLPFAHNVVWDRKRQLLWSAAKNKLYALRYNFNCSKPDLSVVDSLDLPGTDAHDLFPVYGRDLLWLTNPKKTFQVDPAARTVTEITGPYTTNIKSVSSGDKTYPVLVVLPKEKWWTDEVLDNTGKSIFKQEGLKIYKARWILPNLFSYPAGDALKLCQ